jgi:5'-3' exonuclease
MKSMTIRSLISYLIFTLGYLNPVRAVTDAELELLEKQIEQQEADVIQKAETEARRIMEQKQKVKAEAKRKLEEEAIRKAEKEKQLSGLEEQRKREKLAEQKRIEEEKKEKNNLLLSKGRDLALIKEGAKLSTPIGDISQYTKDAAIDGITNNYGGLHGYSHSQWNIPGSFLLVTLKEVSLVNKIRFLLWDKDNRYYQYRLEVSRDQKDWEVLADKSSGEWRSWQEFVVEPKKIKYIKIVGLYNSHKIFFADNVWFHVVELEAFGLPLSELSFH